MDLTPDQALFPTVGGGTLVVGSAAAGAGLSAVRYDAEGRMSLVRTVAVDHPSYAAVGGPGGTVVHAVVEQEAGRVVSFGADSGVLAPTPLAGAASGGAGPCHLAVHPGGSHLFVAHYGDGVLSVLPTGADGAVAGGATQTIRLAGREPEGDLLTAPHAHMAAPSPDGRFLLCTDLGTDRIHVYAFEGASGRLRPHGTVQLPGGRGPRHLVFHPAGRYVHVVNELSSTLTVCTWDAASGSLEAVAELETRQDPGSPTVNYAAAVRLSADGRFLYTTNRGDDAIAVHAVREDGASVELLATVPCGGVWPRDIALTPDGRLLFCANQRSDSLTAFHVDPSSGALTRAGEPLTLTEPTSVLPVGP
ncbi:lactonase family protein [Kitasatospora sp. NPDC101183]|uniref:lactonase family protein n=1 Tax=Kitasatospora sp. NPDC101183 TaxID=3364100 RepID=UPI00381AE46B